MLSAGCRASPVTGKELGIATDCPGSSKKWEGKIFVQDLFYARCLYILYRGLFNLYNRSKRLLILDMRCQQDWAKVTQVGGGRARIPTSAWAPKTYDCLSSTPCCRPRVPSDFPSRALLSGVHRPVGQLAGVLWGREHGCLHCFPLGSSSL